MRLITAIILAPLCLSAGCASAISYVPGRGSEICKAPQNGQYVLFAERQKQPVYDAILLRGDAIGFEHDSHGTLVALADTQRQPLPEGRYAWRHVTEPIAVRQTPSCAEISEAASKVGETLAAVAMVAPLYVLQSLCQHHQGFLPTQVTVP